MAGCPPLKPVGPGMCADGTYALAGADERHSQAPFSRTGVMISSTSQRAALSG